MLQVPTLFPVTTPVVPFTDATEAFEEVHAVGVAAVAVPKRFSVEPLQTEAVLIDAPPLVRLTVGEVLTDMDNVFEQPLEFVYVMVDVPALNGVTKPPPLTVATEVLDDCHGVDVAAIGVPVRVTELPIHKLELPVMVGLAFIVTR